ncbi:MAG: glycoside hydrolase family 43 protein [Verrucomicrobiota bacterium]
MNGTCSSSDRASGTVPATDSSASNRARSNKAGHGLALLVILASVLALPAHAGSQYIFATFKGEDVPDEKLWIYTSADALNFAEFSDTGGYGGPTGVLRDPSIMKHTDGKYYICHTVQSWTDSSTNFAIASSTDLVHWTNLTTINADVPGTYYTWAPEWFVDDDGTVNIIVNIGPDDTNFKQYLFTAQNSELTSWSGPVDMGITPNHIDAFVVKVGGTYHAFVKNETTKFIEHATSSSLIGGWTWVGTDNWSGWGPGYEGPALIQMDNGQWRIYVELYPSGGIRTATSADLYSWSGLSFCLSGARHGTVIKEPVSSPTINVSASDGNMTLSWPLPSLGLTLVCNTNLTSGTWTEVSQPPQMVGSQWQVTVPMSGDQQFFRLQH